MRHMMKQYKYIVHKKNIYNNLSRCWSYACRFKIKNVGNSLVVQWLGLGAFTVEGPGSISVWGTKILQVMQHDQEISI